MRFVGRIISARVISNYFQGELNARNQNQGIRMFQHGSRSFSRHIVCRSEVCAANHRRGDSFGIQCRLPVGRHGYEPSPNILNVFPTISCFS